MKTFLAHSRMLVQIFGFPVPHSRVRYTHTLVVLKQLMDKNALRTGCGSPSALQLSVAGSFFATYWSSGCSMIRGFVTCCTPADTKSTTLRIFVAQYSNISAPTTGQSAGGSHKTDGNRETQFGTPRAEHVRVHTDMCHK